METQCGGTREIPRTTHQPVSQEHRVNSAKKTTQVKASQSWPHDGPRDPFSLVDHVCTAMKTVPQILEDDAVRSSSEARPERCGPHESGSTKTLHQEQRKRKTKKKKRCSTAACNAKKTTSKNNQQEHEDKERPGWRSQKKA